METNEEEIQLHFKRFSAEKQEQIRQLVAYTSLMGLTGKDLVSIGGKLDRIEKGREREYKLSIVKSYDIKPIGKDTNSLEKLAQRFKLKINDINYHFENNYNNFKITNTNTKAFTVVGVHSWYDFGRVGWRTSEMYSMLWELHQGHVLLP